MLSSAGAAAAGRVVIGAIASAVAITPTVKHAARRRRAERGVFAEINGRTLRLGDEGLFKTPEVIRPIRRFNRMSHALQ